MHYKEYISIKKKNTVLEKNVMLNDSGSVARWFSTLYIKLGWNGILVQRKQ